MSGTGFQVELSGAWEFCSAEEDKIPKSAYLSGFPHAEYSLRGHEYKSDFQQMKQTNLGTGKEPQIRPPDKLRGPSAPITKPGPATCITVPPGSQGTTVQVPNPEDKKAVTAVDVPATAKVGQAFPKAAVAAAADAAADAAAMAGTVAMVAGRAVKAMASAAVRPAKSKVKSDSVPIAHTDEKERKKWSTGAKAAPEAGGVVFAGGLAVGGFVLAEHIAEEGLDATMDDVGDIATSAGEGIAEGAEATMEWVVDAADTAGDLISDLF